MILKVKEYLFEGMKLERFQMNFEKYQIEGKQVRLHDHMLLAVWSLSS